MQTRFIPSTQEALPVIGLGTYRGFDITPGVEASVRLAGVLKVDDREYGGNEGSDLTSQQLRELRSIKGAII